MIERAALLAALKPEVTAAEQDLAAQVRALPEVKQRLRAEYEQAWTLRRTGATWTSWLGERITQVAAAWVLSSVFVRFCEDNGLIPQPYLTGPSPEQRDVALARYEAYVDEDPDPTYRGWLRHAFAELDAGQAGRELFDSVHNPLHQIPLSHDGARRLVEFWRQRGEDGSLVHDFTHPLSADGTTGWDTRFLGDVYQDLSESARTSYALLQTPEFVEEFILDRTMTPAIDEFGFTELRMIDPTCGSGHFVLSAFRRLMQLWNEERPAVDRYQRVRSALESVHGVDVNPFAIAIARFRLLVAAMAAAGIATLAEANKQDWPIQLAVGDSLLAERQTELGIRTTVESSTGTGQLEFVTEDDPDSQNADFSYTTEDVHEFPKILQPGRYHVVVGNPPYITVKDPKLNEEAYSAGRIKV